jgi:mannose-6-phosphate isomerase
MLGERCKYLRKGDQIMRPFLLKPAFKDYLWGGDKLKRLYNKQTDLELIAESWELSVYEGSESVIASGELSGMTLRESARKYPELLGANGGIKLLIKLIDAKQNLSVQVHPDDHYAARVEKSAGKTEVWHVLESEPGAFLYHGFARGTTAKEVRDKICDNTITEILRKVYVKPGDTFFIPAGTIHAIGAGIVIAEIQQSSDLTYRVYDFDRRGTDGKPRELHIQKALDVMNFEAHMPENGQTPENANPAITRLASCRYFTADQLLLNGVWEGKTDGNGYLSVLCTNGQATLDCNGHLDIKKGDSIFIPAGNPEFSLSGKGNFLITSQN